MAQQWDGILLRSDLDDPGAIPRNALANSPDIVIAGTAPLPDPGILAAPGQYGMVVDQGISIGLPNYIYVRGENGTTDTLSGNWSLFYATPNLLLYPYLWQQNGIATASGYRNPPFTIDAGAIGVNTDPFTWVPSDLSDNYCLVAIAGTPGHGNPLQGIDNITDLAEALSLNANIAQRNVLTIRGSLPQIVFSTGYNQGTQPAVVDISVLFENIPAGSSYTISAGTPLNGMVLNHSDPNTTDSSFRYSWTALQIPAQWSTLFTCVLGFGGDWSGIPPGAKPRITIRVDLLQEGDQPLYHLGSEPGPNLLTGQPRLGGGMGPIRTVTVGSYAVTCPDMGP